MLSKTVKIYFTNKYTYAYKNDDFKRIKNINHLFSSGYIINPIYLEKIINKIITPSLINPKCIIYINNCNTINKYLINSVLKKNNIINFKVKKINLIKIDYIIVFITSKFLIANINSQEKIFDLNILFSDNNYLKLIKKYLKYLSRFNKIIVTGDSIYIKKLSKYLYINNFTNLIKSILSETT